MVQVIHQLLSVPHESKIAVEPVLGESFFQEITIVEVVVRDEKSYRRAVLHCISTARGMRSGSVTRKVEPSATRLFATMAPMCRIVIRRQRARPIPVPSYSPLP